MKTLDLYIGEGFEGPGVNAAHINILIGPRNGPASQLARVAKKAPDCEWAGELHIVETSTFAGHHLAPGIMHGHCEHHRRQAGLLPVRYQPRRRSHTCSSPFSSTAL